MAEKIRRFSRKREAIKNVLAGTKSHPDAEWVYSKLKPDFPDLSLATVYRNLCEMKKSGEIQSVAFFAGRERFDAVTRKHSHFICDSCGSISDFDIIGHDIFLDQYAQENFDGRIDFHTVVFHGLCKDCVKKEAFI